MHFAGPQNYQSYGVAVCEAEVDVLTGEHQFIRCDILFDCGISMNPAVDIGQIEGAFIQGLGYMTTEELPYDTVYNPGQPIAIGTWEYKPPEVLDIPIGNSSFF